MQIDSNGWFNKISNGVRHLFEDAKSLLPQAVKPAPAPTMTGDSLSVSSVARNEASKATQPKLSGSFLQLNGGDNDKPVEYWLKELGSMQKIGMDTAVVQYCAYGDTELTPATEKILQAADQLGMKVMVGTKLSESGWYTNQFSDKYLQQKGKEVADYTRDLVQQFSSHPSLQGIYIPYETNLSANAADIGAFYGQISNAAKEANPNLKTMISPYTNLIPGVPMSMPEGVMTSNFKAMLQNANVDILAWQDGVGGTKDQLNRIDHDLGAIAAACKDQGVELWADVEGFERTTKFYDDFSAKPVSMDTLKQQMEKEAPYVSKIISFDFNDYMSPQKNDDTASLYREYEEYLKQTNQ